MAVTLIALSIVRERAEWLARPIPRLAVRANEIVIGKVMAFGMLGGGIAALSVWLLVTFLGRPAARRRRACSRS